MELLKVFIVEDESIVREGLRDMIPWEQNGFVFSGDAPDGEVALPEENIVDETTGEAAPYEGTQENAAESASTVEQESAAK